MILNRLNIVNYKNIQAAELEFSPNVNCFLGNNGMGKTNLLDAIYYLSFCKSFTHLPDSQNICHGEDFFMLQGYYMHNGQTEELYCGMKRRQKKQFKRNKKEYDRLADHIGFIPLVMISPNDTVLIQGLSEERRRFIDQVISQSDKNYLEALIRYNKALQQRNALLKSETSATDEMFDLWEEQMIAPALFIYRQRKEFIDQFLPVFESFYKQISLDNEQVNLIYESNIDEVDLRLMLQTSRQRDLIIGYTTKGIHRDDLLMNLGEYPMKKIGSQGQNKTFLIALKLAQFIFLQKQGGIPPILLLDDIFDKLDNSRVEQIIRLVSSDQFGQIFITDTNREYVDRLIAQTGRNYHLYSVDRGQITNKETGGI